MPDRAHVHGGRPPAEDARDDHGPHGARAPRGAGQELLPLQQQDFEGLFAAMPGRPITIRLLDPPLHEFLPDRVELAQRVQQARDERAPELAALEQELELVLRMGEVNPMLGTRGCRLGIVHPEIYEMQVEAIMRAARAADAPPRLEIMIPLVDFEAELAEMRELVVRVGERHGLRAGEDYLVGTMIELPRACFVADRLAADADFFSFGTNDLTQTALGLLARRRRGRVRPRLPRAPDHRPLAVRDDRRRRRRRARRDGRRRAAAQRREDIELGVCGEHGGDPDSIAFFHRGRPRLRVLLALPAADRPRGGGAGRIGGAMKLELVPRRPAAAAAASTTCCRRSPRTLLHQAVGLGRDGARRAPDLERQLDGARRRRRRDARTAARLRARHRASTRAGR